MLSKHSFEQYLKEHCRLQNSPDNNNIIISDQCCKIVPYCCNNPKVIITFVYREKKYSLPKYFAKSTVFSVG